jgi:pimeloyl-ACP methyl ester carboxylesterase
MISWSLTAALSIECATPDQAFDSDFRWGHSEEAVQTAVAERLGGSRGARRIAQRVATVGLRRARTTIMKALAIAVGDIIVYTQSRDEILDRVDIAVRGAAQHGPVYLVGHSLGGIIGLDYCISRGSVSRLATVGSQVGLFAEWDYFNLARDVHTGKLIPPFTGQWVNIYDANDMLSFLTEPIFSGVRDVRVNTGAPFPVSHSEYWRRSDVFEHLTGA